MRILPFRQISALSEVSYRADYDNLRYQYERHAYAEIPLMRLVMERRHAEHGADAAADNGDVEKRALADPPRALLGAALVLSHEDEADDVDDGEV